MLVTGNVGSLKDKLKEVFGYDNFRGNQEEIIQNVLDGNNTFVIMPTGAGKSLCYQLPALMLEGTAVVISPLIALMKNQVDQLNALGITAYFLNSSLSKSESNKVKRELLEGNVKLLYVAPESLTKEATIELLKKTKLSFVAIDEAHCISEWGHDFRPEYRRIKSIIEDIQNLPLIALTATATPKVRADIQKNLKIEIAKVFLSSFHRKNLFYEVMPKIQGRKQLIKFVQQFKGKCGIVYCLSRKKVEQIAELLKVNGVNALPYHAGMDSAIRMRNQDAFLNEDVEVIVATIAFGMGIDKPDVRFVVHYDAPKSIEGYYQETGRAGRDGIESHCLMFYSEKDISKLEKFNKDKTVTERENSLHLLREVTHYSKSAVCRQRQLLYYFGEYLEEDCGYCDNCKRERDSFAGQELVTTAMQTVKLTEERFDMNHLVDVVRGVENQYVKSYGHDKLPVFGKGKNETEEYWMSIFRQVMLMNMMVKDIDDITIMKITEKGTAFLENPHSVLLYKLHDFEADITDDEDEISSAAQHQASDPVLFDMLKALRKEIAKRKNLPPYVIFQDPSLEEMATMYPCSENDLAQINGVGQGKVRKFGREFIALISKYVADNDIETASDVVVKSTVNKSKTKIFIITQIDRMIDLDEIAESKGTDLSELLDEIEHICYSGTKLNLDYYIDQMMDEDRQDEVFQYFMEAESDSIQEALDELGDEDYSEEELRLMRIKFLSEISM